MLQYDIDARERIRTDDGEEGARGFLSSAYRCVPLQPLLAYVNTSEAPVASRDYRAFLFETAGKLEEVYGNKLERTSEELDESVDAGDPWEFFRS
jgi:hypothetical protein